MKFFHSISLVSISLVGSVIAQSSTVSSAAAVKTHLFSVGADGRTFTPHNRTVPIGDIIEFRFYPQNHSVVKAEFGPEPCIPYEITGAGKVGWWSGWKPTAVVDTANQPIFRIQINDTEPLSVYCSSPNACKEGMVAVINGNETHNYASQLAYTQTATAFLSPGEYFPEEKLDPETTHAPKASGNAGDGHDVESHPHPLGTGAIVGIAIGGFAVLCLAGGIFYMCGRHKSFKEIMKRPSSKNGVSGSDTTTAYHPASPGLSEANYPNMHKSPAMSDARYSANTYGRADSYRSSSPPIDEGRGNSMFGVMNGGGQLSPGMGSPSWPSPSYQEMHEADATASVKGAAHSPTPYQVHEMAAAVPVAPVMSPNTPGSTFSYTNNESAYGGHR